MDLSGYPYVGLVVSFIVGFFARSYGGRYLGFT